MKFRLVARNVRTGEEMPFVASKYLPTLHDVILIVDNKLEYNIMSYKIEEIRNEARKAILAFLELEDSSINLEHYIAVCHDLCRTPNSYHARQLTMIEVDDLLEWAKQEAIDRDYISSDFCTRFKKCVDWEAFGQILLEDDSWCELPNGNFLIYF